MRRLTIKGFKTAGFLLKAAASGIESLLEETYPVVQVVEGKSADARPLAFTENQRWVNGNVDMTDYVLAWQDIPKCRNEKVVLPI